jgi:hypothetical protein
MTNMINGYIYAGQVDRMEAMCEGSTFDPFLTKYGEQVIVSAMREKPLSLDYGLKARAMLVRKVISLGVDLMPAYLELTGAAGLDEVGKAKALKPAAMLKTILASPPIDPRLHISASSLDEFLVLIPLDVIRKSRKCEEASTRRFRVGLEKELLAYGTNKVKGKFIEDALGL